MDLKCDILSILIIWIFFALLLKYIKLFLQGHFWIKKVILFGEASLCTIIFSML
jgi:hypothetical protein